jgi:hypothetical protein
MVSTGVYYCSFVRKYGFGLVVVVVVVVVVVYYKIARGAK